MKGGENVKALSVRNPYANDIFCDYKKYEFRTWSTNYRGDLLICSTANPKIIGTICGYALCVVRLNDVIEVTAKNYKDFNLDEKPEGKLYAWQLTDNRLIMPFAVKGKLNFFDVDDAKIEFVPDFISDKNEAKKFEEYIQSIVYKGRKTS